MSKYGFFIYLLLFSLLIQSFLLSKSSCIVYADTVLYERGIFDDRSESINIDESIIATLTEASEEENLESNEDLRNIDYDIEVIDESIHIKGVSKNVLNFEDLICGFIFDGEEHYSEAFDMEEYNILKISISKEHSIIKPTYNSFDGDIKEEYAGDRIYTDYRYSEDENIYEFKISILNPSYNLSSFFIYENDGYISERTYVDLREEVEKTYTYTVKFDEEFALDDIKVKKEDKFMLPTYIDAIKGYKVRKWILNSDKGYKVSEGPDYEYNFFAVAKGGEVLIAEPVLEPISYNVHFDLFGGEGRIDDISVKFTDKVVMPANYEKRGYILNGWECGEKIFRPEEEASGLGYKDGETVNINALWEPKEYIINLVFEEEDNIKKTEKKVLYGERIGELPEPIKQGYSFLSWRLKSDKDKVIDEAYIYEFEHDIELVPEYELRRGEVINYINSDSRINLENQNSDKELAETAEDDKELYDGIEVNVNDISVINNGNPTKNNKIYNSDNNFYIDKNIHEEDKEDIFYIAEKKDIDNIVPEKNNLNSDIEDKNENKSKSKSFFNMIDLDKLLKFIFDNKTVIKASVVLILFALIIIIWLIAGKKIEEEEDDRRN